MTRGVEIGDTPGSSTGGRILIIEPLSSGVELVRVARRLGLSTVVASYDDAERALPQDMRRHVDTLIRVDPNDEAELTERIVRFHEHSPLIGIVPGVESYVAVAARLAARLGLPGQPVATAEALRDKSAMRDRVRAAGLRVPRYALVTDGAMLDAAAEHVGFPAVLKPVASSGSVQVSRVDDAEQLRLAYQRILEDRRPDDVGQFLDGRVLLEQYLPGPDLSVEGYVVDGRVEVVSVTKKFVGPEPHFVEVGHVVQFEMDQDRRDAIESYVAAVCEALGVVLGPFHCELRLVDGEPVLVELGARLAGGRIIAMIELVTGLSLWEIMLAAHAGWAVGPGNDAGPPQAKFAGIHMFTAPGLSAVGEVRGLERVRSADYVREAEVYLRPGDQIPEFGDFRSRIGHALFVADSYEQAVARKAEIEAMVHFG